MLLEQSNWTTRRESQFDYPSSPSDYSYETQFGVKGCFSVFPTHMTNLISFCDVTKAIYKHEQLFRAFSLRRLEAKSEYGIAAAILLEARIRQFFGKATSIKNLKNM